MRVTELACRYVCGCVWMYVCVYVCVCVCVCIVPMAWVLWNVTRKLNLYESDRICLQVRVCAYVCV